MGVWKDKLDFLVLWMENFDVILGADFAVKAKPRIFFNYNSLLLCMKPHKRPVVGQGVVIYAREETLLTNLTLLYIHPKNRRTTDVGLNPRHTFLRRGRRPAREFHDIIPTKLPTILLSSWDIKHAIELLAREHPLARAPYKMSDKSSLS
ncbi:unnamed protein product [Spirodela intermedia]|uniref:Uncharacterized protein n=1 Tax=Spirodela intermedia TaxID=51605 RepID=A0A7I8IXF0_SPIIN|nr:unnamed protein product [Spirodela intermedia]CAA6662459.1 unnamed protein product [Spirodela intermedia]